MTAEKTARLWLLATFLLIIIIIISSLVIWVKRDKGQPIAISPPTDEYFQGDIYVDGSVNNPGLYPFKNTDDLLALIQASGGADSNADMSAISLYIPSTFETNQSQKIDINRAEAWLLQALPDIGQTKAQAILDYRRQNGLFRNISEITSVQGISTATFEKIKDLITVSE
jgi:competence protein ComEA